MDVRWSRRAASDLADIVEYLEGRSPKAANAVRHAIHTSLSLLADFPEMAPRTDVPGVHEMTLVRYPYKIYYAIEDDAVWVVHVRDARRVPWPEE